MIDWRLRPVPLAPEGAFARGGACAALRARLLAMTDSDLAELSGVHGEDLLVVLGRVPWVDGLVWLGRDARAAGLWLPTHRVPDVPIELLARAVARGAALPAVLLPAHIVSVATARPIDRATLAASR